MHVRNVQKGPERGFPILHKAVYAVGELQYMSDVHADIAVLISP